MEMAIALAETTCSTYTNLDDVFKLFDFFVMCKIYLLICTFYYIFLYFDRLYYHVFDIFLLTGTGTGTLFWFWAQSPPTVVRLGGSTVASSVKTTFTFSSLPYQTKCYALSAVGQ